MPETYGAHECRVYFVVEQNYGETPSNPAMVGVNTEGVEPTVDSGLIKVRGIGSRDLQSLYRGVRRVHLKIPGALSSESPIALIQHVQTLNSLSVQVLYYKGLFSDPMDVISFLYKGCRIDKVTVECEVDDVLRATVECVGQDVAVGTSKITGASYGDYAGAVSFEWALVSRGDANGSNLVEVLRVSGWKWSIENNLKGVPVIRSEKAYLVKYLRPRHRSLSGEVEFEFESSSEVADVISDSEFSLQFGLGPKQGGGSHTALFKYCRWEEVGAPTKIEDLIALKAKFVARDMWIS